MRAQLGLLLGTSLWHAMYGTTLSSESSFESRMSSLSREIGDRGRADATAPTSSLHKELLAAKVSVLRKRAASAGISEDELEEADDADDLKTALIDLILAAEEPAVGAATSALRTQLQALKVREISKQWLQDSERSFHSSLPLPLPNNHIEKRATPLADH